VSAILQSGLASEDWRALIMRALEEDLGQGDITSQLTIPEDRRARGEFNAKQKLVVAGLAVAQEVFRALEQEIEFQPLVEDGELISPGTPLARVMGSARTLLAGERVSLNFLQRLSGIATLTRRYAAQLSGLKVQLLDTRKTTPGLRALEKYAVRAGGGTNHRMRLDDGILIKNNHLAVGGGIRAAIEKARAGRTSLNLKLPIEVEVRSVGELREVLAAGADAALLDNMTPDEVRACVAAAAGRVRLEVSGGVTLENLRAYAETGVDCISVGALTHSAPAADINFLIQPL
jgi:nicotinate-nucleotide pyrophosphorylase (carboxylating)